MTDPDSGESLRAAWHEAAHDWIRWARTPEHDHAFWRLNLPSLVSLLPPPPLATLDVGCGEGRLARRLHELGYRVVGVESSETLASAAREAGPPLDVRVADAAAVPLADDSFDLAVASLSLMNMDDMPAVVAEVARVLRPGGSFCFSLLHPLSTLGDAGSAASYFDEVRYSERLERGGLRLTLHDTHRPLADYFEATWRAGFVVERLVEPTPDDAYVADHPDVARWRERPAFLHVRATLTRAIR